MGDHAEEERIGRIASRNEKARIKIGSDESVELKRLKSLVEDCEAFLIDSVKAFRSAVTALSRHPETDSNSDLRSLYRIWSSQPILQVNEPESGIAESSRFEDLGRTIGAMARVNASILTLESIRQQLDGLQAVYFTQAATASSMLVETSDGELIHLQNVDLRSRMVLIDVDSSIDELLSWRAAKAFSEQGED